MQMRWERELNQTRVSEVLRELRVYEQLLTAEGVPFSQQKLPGESDLTAIEEKLKASAGAAPDDLVAWFQWQGGVPIGPERGRAVVYGGFRPVGIDEAISESEFRSSPPIGYPAVPSGEKNPWVVLAIEQGIQTLKMDVHTGEIHTVFNMPDASSKVADSILEMLYYWTELWKVAFKWVPGIGVDNKIPLRDIPPELKQHSGYGWF